MTEVRRKMMARMARMAKTKRKVKNNGLYEQFYGGL